MLSGIKHLWHIHKFLLIAFMLAATLTLVFAVRIAFFSIYWADPEHKNQMLEGWMTPRYIAHSYRLEHQDVRRTLGFRPTPQRHEHIDNLLRDQNVTLEFLQDQLDRFVATRAAK